MNKEQIGDSLKMALGIILGVGGLVLLIRVVGPLPLSVSQITTNKQTNFEVSGEAEMSVVPDKATVSLGISVSELTVKAAQNKANSVIEKVSNELTRLGVDKKDIKTNSYSLNPNYDYNRESSSNPKIIGYGVNASLGVTFRDFDKLNEAIDAATMAGVNRVGGISFGVSDDKLDDYQRELRKKAIDDAKDKANELAGLSGMRLGKIINVYENRVGVPAPMRQEISTFDAAVGSTPTKIEPGSTSLNVSVTLSYETL